MFAFMPAPDPALVAELVALDDQFRGAGLTVLGITAAASDAKADGTEPALALADDVGRATADAFHADPARSTLFLIDHQGRITAADLDSARLTAAVLRTLNARVR